jgi:hypothetical protein
MPDGFALVPVEKVKAGTRLIADGGFTCLEEGEVVTVEAEDDGELFVRCCADDNGEPGKPVSKDRNEHHGLDGQLDDEGKNYVGFWLADAP